MERINCICKKCNKPYSYDPKQVKTFWARENLCKDCWFRWGAPQ